jgi:hypothetical protein
MALEAEGVGKVNDGLRQRAMWQLVAVAPTSADPP